MMRVLVVEDNALLRHHLKVQLQDLGIRWMMQKMQRKRTII
jgi:CheY-like chemotaxis protein